MFYYLHEQKALRQIKLTPIVSTQTKCLPKKPTARFFNFGILTVFVYIFFQQKALYKML